MCRNFGPLNKKNGVFEWAVLLCLSLSDFVLEVWGDFLFGCIILQLSRLSSNYIRVRYGGLKNNLSKKLLHVRWVFIT